jgi:hypothetical protein
VERRDQRIDRRIVDWLEYPLAVLDPQIRQHREWLFSLLNDGPERHHDLGDGGLELKRSRLRVGDVGDDEVRKPRKYPDSFGEVLGLGLVEVEDDGRVDELT